MNDITLDNKIELFNNWINDYSKDDEKYTYFNLVVKDLNIPFDKFEDYKDVFTNDNFLDEYYNFINWIKSDVYIKEKINNYKDEKVKLLNYKYNKIYILKNILNKITDNIYDLDSYDYSKYNIITDDDYKLIKKVFKTTIKKPNDEKMFKKLIINMYKCITNILISK
jgi:hypothetical protein